MYLEEPHPDIESLAAEDTSGSKAPTNYPTDEEAKFAQQQGFDYGKDYEAFTHGHMARIIGNELTKYPDMPQKIPFKDLPKKFMPLPATGGHLSEALNEAADAANIDLTNPDNKDISEKFGTHFAKAAIVANSIPIAALGFDPSRVGLDIVRKESTISGAYKPSTDTIYSNMTSPANLIHESIHRGLEILKQSPEGKKIVDKLPEEEIVVRYLMMNAPHRGDLEAQYEEKGIIKNRDREFAKLVFSEALGSYKIKNLDALQKLAQELIKKRRPGGPR